MNKINYSAMTDVKICRICLSKGVTMYDYNKFHLKQYYEQILASKVNLKDDLPHYFCYMCAAMLNKFHKFKEKCRRGQKALKDLLQNEPLTLTSVCKIDRVGKNLKSPIDIVFATKRVKTLIMKNNTSKTSLKEIDDPYLRKQMVHKETQENLVNKEVKIIVHKIHLEDKNMPESSGEESGETINDNVLNEFGGVKDCFKPLYKVEGEECYSELTYSPSIQLSENTELENDDYIQINYSSQKEQKKANTDKIQDTAKDNPNSKGKKKDVPNVKRNYLDPNHWAKITLDEDEALEAFQARVFEEKYVTAPFKCRDCFKGFSKEDMLNRHFKLRHCESIGPIVCRFCRMHFKSKCFLTRHIAQHYTKYKCLRCDLICALKNTALFHNEYHNGVVRNCMHCGEEFRHLSTYYTHLRTHRSEHVCTLCGASFVSEMGLKLHKRTMHIDTLNNPEKQISTYCERCDIHFETQSAYEQHLLHSAMHGVRDPKNPPTLLKGIKRHHRRNPRKFSTCDICNKNFSTYKAFVKHHKAEHKDVPIKDLNGRHICEICGASLAANSVASHLNSHTRQKLYPCPTCGMEFKCKSSMKRHLLVHTGEKPFGCSLCDKRFTQKGSMKLHFRTFHLREPYPKRNRRKKSFHMNEQC